MVQTNFESFDIKLLLVLVSDACWKRLTSYLARMAQGGVWDSGYWQENPKFTAETRRRGENRENLAADHADDADRKGRGYEILKGCLA